MRPSTAIATLTRLRAVLTAEADELTRQAPGTPVWRVADAAGFYCLELSRDDCMDPKAECDLWLHENPERAKRGYTVQPARTFSHAERALLKAAERLRALAAD